MGEFDTGSFCLDFRWQVLRHVSMPLTMSKREEKINRRKKKKKNEFGGKVFGDNEIWSIKGGADL